MGGQPIPDAAPRPDLTCQHSLQHEPRPGLLGAPPQVRVWCEFCGLEEYGPNVPFAFLRIGARIGGDKSTMALVSAQILLGQVLDMLPGESTTWTDEQRRTIERARAAAVWRQ